MNNIPKISIKHYPQYDIFALKNKEVFGLTKKRFFRTEKNVIEIAIVENKAHYRMLGNMLFLYESHKQGILISESKSFLSMIMDNPDAGTMAYTIKNIHDFWAAFFECEVRGNNDNLVYVCQNLLRVVDQNIINFWTICENNGTLADFYDEDNINQFIKDCEYIPKAGNRLGKVIYPTDFSRKIKQVKNIVNPLVTSGLDFIINKLSPFADYKTRAEKLKEECDIVLKDYLSLSDEEKITFAESFLKNNSHYKESTQLMINIRSLYISTKKYKLNDITIHIEYEKLLNKHLFDLLNFVNIYKNQPMNDILIQINSMNEMVKKMTTHYNEEIERQIRIKNRFLKEKLK